MTTSLWTKFASGRLADQCSRRDRGKFRPRLERLEDRSVPSAGALDPTFGSGGLVVSTSNTSTANGAELYAVALQPDGRIVAAGGDSTAATGEDFAVLRYNSNGSLDTTFGGTGKFTTER